jgi:alpha-ribazole phosphatase
VTAAITVHLMRHGEPTLAGRLLGRTDCPATPAGIAACVEAARGLTFHHVASSDLVRAIGCAAPIASLRQQTAAHGPRWRELDFGRWDGLPPAAIDRDELARFWADPEGCAPPDGERWSAIVARVGEALDTIEDGTLVVTHAGAMRAALAAACGFDARQVWAFDLPYAAVLSLRLWRGEPAAAQIIGLRA